MTPTKRAEKIWEDCRGASKANALPFIIEAIEEAELEGYKDGVNAFNRLVETMDQTPIKNESYKEGFSAARERATGIAENHICEDACGCLPDVAIAISAMTPEGENKK